MYVTWLISLFVCFSLTFQAIMIQIIWSTFYVFACSLGAILVVESGAHIRLGTQHFEQEDSSKIKLFLT